MKAMHLGYFVPLNKTLWCGLVGKDQYFRDTLLLTLE